LNDCRPDKVVVQAAGEQLAPQIKCIYAGVENVRDVKCFSVKIVANI